MNAERNWAFIRGSAIFFSWALGPWDHRPSPLFVPVLCPLTCDPWNEAKVYFSHWNFSNPIFGGKLLFFFHSFLGTRWRGIRRNLIDWNVSVYGLKTPDDGHHGERSWCSVGYDVPRFSRGFHLKIHYRRLKFSIIPFFFSSGVKKNS